jgi:hypothetical protein
MNGTTHTNGRTSTYVQSPESIPFSEFEQCITTVRKALQPASLIGLVAFGDCWRGANVCYFTDFRPLDGVSDIANAIFFLGIDSAPALFVSKQCVDYASEVTAFPVYSFDELNAKLKPLHRNTKVAAEPWASLAKPTSRKTSTAA